MNAASIETIPQKQADDSEQTSLNKQRLGFSGYIASRPIEGNRIPQHIQNLVVREYAKKNQLEFNLSATEYNCQACYLLLEQLLNEIDQVDGIILYSLFMLPERYERRKEIYQVLIEKGRTLHAAVEDYQIATWQDVDRVEAVFRLNDITKHCPSNPLL